MHTWQLLQVRLRSFSVRVRVLEGSTLQYTIVIESFYFSLSLSKKNEVTGNTGERGRG